MSFLNQPIKVSSGSPYQWWRISTFVLLSLMIGSLVMSAIYIYNYTIRALEDAHTIVLLNNDRVVSNVNMPAYSKAVYLVGLKSPTSTDPKLRNIFNYGVFTRPSTSTATTSYGQPH